MAKDFWYIQTFTGYFCKCPYFAKSSKANPIRDVLLFFVGYIVKWSILYMEVKEEYYRQPKFMAAVFPPITAAFFMFHSYILYL